MRTTHTSSPALNTSATISPLVTFFTKLPGTVLALGLFYTLPLVLYPTLLSGSILTVPVLACAIVFLTQPAVVSAETTNPKDKRSMLYLIAALTLTQNACLAERGYSGASSVFAWNAATIGGLVLIVVSLTIRVWAIQTLNRYFSNIIVIQEGHQLIQEGPYRYVRHGSYTGAYFTAIGIGIWLSAWWAVLLTVFVLGWAYRFRIVHEEKALVAHFGDQYRAYQKRTWMLIPFVF